jgi:hypothetical protein
MRRCWKTHLVLNPFEGRCERSNLGLGGPEGCFFQEARRLIVSRQRTIEARQNVAVSIFRSWKGNIAGRPFTGEGKARKSTRIRLQLEAVVRSTNRPDVTVARYLDKSAEVSSHAFLELYCRALGQNNRQGFHSWQGAGDAVGAAYCVRSRVPTSIAASSIAASIAASVVASVAASVTASNEGKRELDPSFSDKN